MPLSSPFRGGQRKTGVGSSISSERRLRAASAVLALICAPLLLAACAANGYAGIPFVPGAAAPELQGLARRAQAGDKQAQLDLGIRYEEGRGVPGDLARAERLYRMAASDSGGTIFIYSPPVGRHGRGRVIPVNIGARQTGRREALARLAALRRRTIASERREPRSEFDSPFHGRNRELVLQRTDGSGGAFW